MQQWIDELGRRTPRAREWANRARRVLPGGVSYAIRDLAPHPFYVDRAKGARVFDVDGNSYVDYWCGHGALILGHAFPSVVDAVTRQIERGSHFGFAHPLEVELAEQVQARMRGAERIRYTNSGTEANLYAVGLARACTGRTRIAKMEGGWHGGVEALNKAVKAPFDDRAAAGLNPAALEATSVVPFNDLDAARRALEPGDVAALLVEPLMGAAGFLPAAPSYLEGLRDLTRHHGTLLVFDEVITGFRLGPAGAQGLYGVTPDITILGKILGGGYPIGALVGRADVFAYLDHRQFPEPRNRAFHGGTFAANPVSVTAGLATLAELANPEVYARLGVLGERARSGLRQIIADTGAEASVTGVGSLVGLHFRRDEPRDARESSAAASAMARDYTTFMLTRGVTFLTPTMPHMFISAAHTEEDIDSLVSLTESFFRLVP